MPGRSGDNLDRTSRRVWKMGPNEELIRCSVAERTYSHPRSTWHKSRGKPTKSLWGQLYRGIKTDPIAHIRGQQESEFEFMILRFVWL